MGLDMMSYRVSRVNGFKEGSRVLEEEIMSACGQGQEVYLVKTGTVEERLNTVKTFGTHLTVVSRTFSPSKLGKHFGIKGVSYIETDVMASNGYVLSCYDRNGKKLGTVSTAWNENVGDYTERECIAILLEELDYQREGLDNWSCLPANGTFTDDKTVVSDLMDNGLKMSFLENWIDGETLFLASW